MRLNLYPLALSGSVRRRTLVKNRLWFEPYRLPWYVRAILVALGLGLMSLLGIAATLRPAAKGYGTHTQLGLAPCTLTEVAGIRCPSCGMTTSWAWFVRGRWIQAVQANAGGTLVALIAAVVGPGALVTGLRGRWFGRPPAEWLVVCISVSIVVVTLTDWCWRLFSS